MRAHGRRIPLESGKEIKPRRLPHALTALGSPTAIIVRIGCTGLSKSKEGKGKDLKTHGLLMETPHRISRKANLPCQSIGHLLNHQNNGDSAICSFDKFPYWGILDMHWPRGIYTVIVHCTALQVLQTSGRGISIIMDIVHSSKNYPCCHNTRKKPHEKETIQYRLTLSKGCHFQRARNMFSCFHPC